MNKIVLNTEDIFETFGSAVSNTIYAIKPLTYTIVAEDHEIEMIRDDDGNYVVELSNELLSRYKERAGSDASAADKTMNFKRGDKRFSGIMRATKKQFSNDEKKVNEASANNTSAHVAASADNRSSISKDSKDDLVKTKNDKTALTLATIRSIKGK